MPRETVQRRKPWGHHPIRGFLVEGLLSSKDAQDVGGGDSEKEEVVHSQGSQRVRTRKGP